MYLSRATNVPFCCSVIYCSAEAMYSVVVLAADDRDGEEKVEAVPSVWLSPGRSHCQRPPLRSQGSIARAMRDLKSSEPGWSTHAAKVLKTCGVCYLLTGEKLLLMLSSAYHITEYT